jgi:hypothetical protein
MNRSKLYVPNPQKWMSFFERVASGKAKLSQSGRGRRQMLSVDAFTDVHDTHRGRQLPVKVVEPAEQTVAQAKSELKRDDINPELVTAALHTAKGRRKRQTSQKKQTTKRQKSGKIVRIKQTGGRKQLKQRNKKQKTYRDVSKADILGF